MGLDPRLRLSVLLKVLPPLKLTNIPMYTLRAILTVHNSTNFGEGFQLTDQHIGIQLIYISQTKTPSTIVHWSQTSCENKTLPQLFSRNKPALMPNNLITVDPKSGSAYCEGLYKMPKDLYRHIHWPVFINHPHHLLKKLNCDHLCKAMPTVPNLPSVFQIWVKLILKNPLQ